ncbi:MAG: hypothetical protein E7300_10060 [Lachnospiraceae bacterium]|nr:hypothetical protein [Lachnospiraceae bacterium]
MNESITRNKRAFLWNTVASTLSSFQSFIILIFISHLGNTQDAGIFTFAYAAANLMMMIGKFGMRRFQASDLSGQYSFGTYVCSRKVTVLLMLVVSASYGIYCSNGSLTKYLIFLLWCGVRAVESYEDVYHGYLHARDRLDLASKIWGARTLLSIIVFAVSYYISGELVLSTVIVFAAAVISGVACNLPFLRLYEKRAHAEFTDVRSLLISNFSLFASFFLQMYLSNAPRYAINSELSDEIQAIYGYLIMPIFLITMFSSFMVQPLITTYTRYWDSSDRKSFSKLIGYHLSLIVAAVVICIIGGRIIGLRLLEIIYNVELKDYAGTLSILLIAGGFQALQSYLMTLLTVIRFHKLLITGFIGAGLLFMLFSGMVVTRWGITGISVYFMLVLALLDLYFAGLLIYRFKRPQGD